MTSHEIQEWKKISANSANYSDTLLIGNGASVAVNKSFDYGSLTQHAFGNGLMPSDVQQLFSFFDTHDFELVLRLVWQASNVNSSLKIPDKDNRAHAAYVSIRDCLIQSVRGIHPKYDEVSEQLPRIYEFLKKFKTVLSLNYDLILYWVMMYGNSEIDDGHKFKDCFLHGSFRDKWQGLRELYLSGGEISNTLVFYPHGNLIFRRNAVGSESKIKNDNQNDSKKLLDTVLESWETEGTKGTKGTKGFVPLFVSEGTSPQKIASIQNSYYLSTVYREVLTAHTESLVIYGWRLDDRDIHILERMSDSGIKRVAVSVHGDNLEYCDVVFKKIRDKLGKSVHIDFFDSESYGCWNKPKGFTLTRSQNLGQA